MSSHQQPSAAISVWVACVWRVSGVWVACGWRVGGVWVAFGVWVAVLAPHWSLSRSLCHPTILLIPMSLCEQ